MDKIKSKIADILKQQIDLRKVEVLGLIEIPPDPKLGDISFPCFTLAKKMKKDPNKIAREITKKIKLPRDSIIKEIKTIGPYINFFFNRGKFAEFVINEIKKDEENFGHGTKKKIRIMVEHSQPNTHKAFHIGHLRNVCLGDSLVRIMRFAGYPLMAANYINDTGQHVARCLWCYLKYHMGEEPKERKGEWLGKIYSEASKKIMENPGFKKEVDEIQQKLEAKDPEIMRLWRKTREWSMEEFKRIYKQLGVEFDVWFYDNELIDGAKKIIKELKSKGIVEEDEGALIVSEKKTGLPTFIVEKSDGTTPYITKDLELARRKFEDYKIDKSIYVVAAPQILHFQQLFKLLELYGFKQAKDCYHLSYELVMMKTGKMSSREGKLILYSELFDTAKKKVLKEIKRRHDLQKTKIEEIAEKIAIGALKYAMLNRDNNKVIYFDWDRVLSFEGNSGPYLQYSLVRAKKILEKSEDKIDYSYSSFLTEEEEFELVKKIYKFPQVVESISNNYKPHLMAEYTFELASLFSRFYEKCPVLQSKEKIKKARLALTWGFIQIMKKCFSLLGIEEVDIM